MKLTNRTKIYWESAAYMDGKNENIYTAHLIRACLDLMKYNLR